MTWRDFVHEIAGPFMYFATIYGMFELAAWYEKWQEGRL